MTKFDVNDLNDKLNYSSAIITSILDNSGNLPNSIAFILKLLDSSFISMNNLISEHDNIIVNITELNNNLDDIINYLQNLDTTEIPAIETALQAIIDEVTPIIDNFNNAKDEYENSLLVKLDLIKSDIQSLLDYTGLVIPL